MTVRPIQIGEYIVRVRDERGRELPSVRRVAKQGFPSIGHGIHINGFFHRVVDVHHVEVEDDSESFRQFTYMYLVVFAERAPDPSAPTRKPEDDGRTDAEPSSERGASSAPSSAVVIPFQPGALDRSSPLYSFFCFLTWVVSRGYRLQSNALEHRKAAVWQLNREGDAWTAEPLSEEHTAETLRLFSRAALREAARADNLLLTEAAKLPVASDDNVVDLNTYRQKGR